MTTKRHAAALLCLLGCAALSRPTLAQTSVPDNASPDGASRPAIHRVLLLSIDGMHALDLANLVQHYAHTTLADLSRAGVTYTNASSSKPSELVSRSAGNCDRRQPHLHRRLL